MRRVVVALLVAQIACSLKMVRPPAPETQYERGAAACTTSSVAPALDVGGAVVTAGLGALTLVKSRVVCRSDSR